MFNLKDERSSFEAWLALKISRKLRDDPRGKLATKGCRGYFAIKCRKLTSFVSGSITVLDGRTLVKCTPVPCLPYFAIEKLGGRDREQFVDRSRNFRINSRTKQSTATSFKRILKMENFLSSLKNFLSKPVKPYFP